MTPEDEQRLESLRLAAETAPDTLARLAALANFLAACESFLSAEDHANDLTVFNEAAFLLGSRVADGLVWDWWQEQARQASTMDRQVTMSIALFEVVVDPPIIWPSLYRFWDFWFDPAARWAVYDAYETHPRRLRSHLSRYSAHRRRLQLPVPEFTYEQYHDAWYNGLPMRQ